MYVPDCVREPPVSDHWKAFTKSCHRSLYFAFLARPLQAWEFIAGAAGKCLILLSNETEAGGQEDQERARRIFWSCYILERQVYNLHLWPHLPPSQRIEEAIP